MNIEEAWLLGYLLSDGCINRPKYRNKGDETHLEFVCKYSDTEILYKVKDILKTKANVCSYPDYKSPQSKIRIYDRKDFIQKYNNIKTQIPEDILGFERHFIRGLTDGDGCLYYRESRDSFVYNYVNEHEHIVKWVTNIFEEKLNIPVKNIRYVEKDHIYSISYEGNIAKLIAHWLYHGNIEHCCLERKRQKYIKHVLKNNYIDNFDDATIYAVNAYIDKNNEIAFNVPNMQTLIWAQRLQKILSYNTVPVFHNKGKRKYYHLYIPKAEIANTQDILN